MLSDDRIISYNMTDNLLTKGIITMNFLEERIMKDGVVKEGNILKVDSFLNHQMDVKLFKQMGEEFKRRFAGKNINKIITIEASGIGIACIVAECFDVPVVFAKKSQSVNIDGDVYSAEVESGDLVIVPSGCLHRTTYNGKGMHERIVISFRNDATEWIQNQTGKELMENCMKPGVVNIPEKRRDYVVALLDKLLFENDSPDELSPAFIKVGLIELLLFIIRCKNYEENVIKEIDVDNRIIQEVATYIYEHYADNLSLEYVADKFNLSRSYLSKKFKTATGFGFKEYIINVRIQNACNLLLETNKSITDIAFECGFNDSNYFGDAFRKAKGISPHKYRKNETF